MQVRPDIHEYEHIRAAGLAALKRQYTGIKLRGNLLRGRCVLDVEPSTRGSTRYFSALLDNGRVLSLHFLIVQGALPPVITEEES